MTSIARTPPRWGIVVIAIAVLIAGAAVILAGMGHPLICTCGTIKLWHGDIFSSENSQHIFDWYTPSHIIHGLLFYFLLWAVARNLPVGTRAILAVAIEVSWEVIENTPWIINRYRGTTISLDYYGDSVLNSTFDALAMVLGFFLALRLPVWVSIAIAPAFEIVVGFLIRDNLVLNVLMLVWPLDAVRVWQGGG